MPNDMAAIVRAANESVLPAINELYSHYIINSHCTFDLEPWSLDKRLAWHRWMTPPWFVYVAEQRDRLAGFTFSNRFRKKAAYDCSVETTVYVNNKNRGLGTGRLLLQHLLDSLAQHDVHRAYAGIAMPNDASIALHETLGYRYLETFREVGFKFGRYHDVAWYEYSFGASSRRTHHQE